MDGLNDYEISITLDKYEDIYSSFDSRPFSHRALSDDFLFELKRASVDKVPGEIELNLHLPASKRNFEQESMIKKRLHEHFKKHYDLLKHEKGDIIKFGLILALIGICLMFAGAYVMFSASKSLMNSFLIVILEPAGWFMFWEGLDQVIFEPKKKQHETEFYHKMSMSKIEFKTH